METSAILKTYRGHGGPVHAVAASRDGKLVAAGGRDGTVRVWDVGPSRQSPAAGASAAGGARSQAFPMFRLCEMRQTGPNEQVSVQWSDRGASGKCPSRIRPDHLRHPLFKLAAERGPLLRVAQPARALRFPGRTGLGPSSVTSQYANPSGRALRPGKNTRSTARA